MLAHELAHLRRWDHLVNVRQRVLESRLFFHPAVWWVSAKVRVEREHVCDDLAVSLGTPPRIQCWRAPKPLDRVSSCFLNNQSETDHAQPNDLCQSPGEPRRFV